MNELKKEMETYQRERFRLMQNKGNFVLIQGDRVLGIHAAYEDALAAGYRQCGLTPFLVKQIQEMEQVHYFTRDILDPCHT
ncbi:MAG: hypothetical protein HY360_23010 [Verrucomicrobia bacterium]|nr:hypothetical protein [Verrucomicrobiota bacterium]